MIKLLRIRFDPTENEKIMRNIKSNINQQK
jgi:hypothetical protein